MVCITSHARMGGETNRMVILAATRSMAMQGVKMRVPSIKFRHGRQHNQPAMSSATPKQAITASQAAASPSPGGNALPLRFVRQAISEEEVEYINRGGPA